LINQDAHLKPGCLKKLVQLQKDNPQYAVLSPIHLSEGENHLDLHFAEFISRSNTRGLLISDLILEKKLKKIYEIDYVNAAVWLLSRQCIDRIGLFNPVFYHYGEDLNYLNRVQFRGFQVGIVPAAYAVHSRKQFYFNDHVLEYEKSLVMMKAVILHKLSRLIQPLWLNLSSVIFQIFTQTIYCRFGYIRKFRFFFHLTGFLFANFIKVIWYRQLSKSENKPFFNIPLEKMVVL
jgi:GT2 family glycosyltransferase